MVHEIGERGETAAYYNCVMDRATFYGLVSRHAESGRGAGEAPAGRLAPRALPELGLSGEERWDLDATVRQCLDPVASVDRRDVGGGPARARVLDAIAHWEEQLA